MCKKNEERETPDDKKYVTEDKTKIWNQKEMITRKNNQHYITDYTMIQTGVMFDQMSAKAGINKFG